MNKELAKTIGSIARTARKALTLTQEDAAEALGVSVEFYARIERGTSLPSVTVFAKIANVLGVSADAMLGRRITVPAIPVPYTAPTDPPEIRRVLRRLRKATPGALRLANLVLKELEEKPNKNDPEAKNRSALTPKT